MKSEPPRLLDSENHIVSMLNVLIVNIFVEFDGQTFQQTIDMPFDTNFVPCSLILYSYAVDII